MHPLIRRWLTHTGAIAMTFATLLTAADAPRPAHAAGIVANTLADANPPASDGLCSLREAIPTRTQRRVWGIFGATGSAVIDRLRLTRIGSLNGAIFVTGGTLIWRNTSVIRNHATAARLYAGVSAVIMGR